MALMVNCSIKFYSKPNCDESSGLGRLYEVRVISVARELLSADEELRLRWMQNWAAVVMLEALL